MTRDEAREHFKKCGLDYSVLTTSNVERLRDLLKLELKQSGCIHGTFRGNHRYKTYDSGCVELTCRADYFSRRETVTFNPDGYIGFAGWASVVNVEPVIAAFVKWCDELAKELTQ